MIQVNVNGTNYRSIAEAWRETSPEGLLLITVRQRLKAGWSMDAAFLTPAIEPKLRRLGHNS